MTRKNIIIIIIIIIPLLTLCLRWHALEEKALQKKQFGVLRMTFRDYRETGPMLFGVG